MRHRLLILARAFLLGWLTLLSIAYLAERPLLRWSASLLGPMWVETAHLSLDCLVLAATGWVVGRSSRPAPGLSVLVFAVTLAFWDFDPLLSINVPLLLRLAWDAFSDRRYLASLISTTAINIFLFGSLIAGVRLSRPRETLPSVIGKSAGSF